MTDAPFTLQPEKFGRCLIVLVCVYVTVRLLVYHWDVVSFPWPLSPREGASLVSTEMLLNGANPYALHHQPNTTNVYGILYPMVTYPFALVFGPGFTVHRAVSAFFLLACCGLLLLVNRFQRVPFAVSWCGVLIFYGALLSGKTVLAEPDALGLFTFLSSLCIPHISNYSRKSIITSLLLGVAAFFIKPYFVLAVPYMASYLFLFRSKKEGIQFGVAALFLSAAAYLLVDRLGDTYFYNTYLVHVHIADNLHDWAVRQMIQYGEMKFGLIAVLAAGVFAVIYRRSWSGTSWSTTRHRPTLLDEPVFRQRPPGFYYFLPLSVALVYFKLGRHGGAYMTYLYQLISPFLVLTACTLSLKLPPTLFRIATAILALNVISVCCNHLGWHGFDRGGSVAAAWREADAMIGSAHNVLGSPTAAPLLLGQGKKIYDSGQSEYFVWSALKPVSGVAAVLFPKVAAIKDQYTTYLNGVDSGIRNKEFDLIVTDTVASNWLLNDHKLKDRYERVRQVGVDMLDVPVMLYFWVPRKGEH